jgi:ABC-type polysaccharide/polyol phosphate export permease
MAAPRAERLGDLWASRELLDNLVRKELKVRFKGSALGFLWSLITPLLMTVVFTIVFAFFLRIPIGEGNFATFFLAGYLMWQFFANSVNASVGTIVGNGPLIRKVYFPREVLPLSLVISQGVHLLLALLVTYPIFVFYRGFHPGTLPALLISLVLLAAFTAGMSMIFAAANVGFRDLQELTQVLFLAWFYATPIIYPPYFVERAPQFIPVIQANPLSWFADLFHTSLYGIPREVGVNPPPQWPSLEAFLICTAWAVGALAVGYWLFHRWAVNFAKEV